MSNDDTNDVSGAARRLASMRRTVEGTCAVCGKPFVGTRKRKFCSHKCAELDSARRRRAAQKAQAQPKPRRRPNHEG